MLFRSASPTAARSRICSRSTSIRSTTQPIAAGFRSPVDLSAYAGEEMEVIFNTYASVPRPAGDARNDLPLWASPGNRHSMTLSDPDAGAAAGSPGAVPAAARRDPRGDRPRLRQPALHPRPGGRSARARAGRAPRRAARDRRVVRHRRAARRADGARHRPGRRSHHAARSRSSRPPAASPGSARRRCFVDIDPVTFNSIRRRPCAAITPRTRAIIPVHLYGLCADMDPILGRRRELRALPVIEDAAQAIGATYKGRQAGSMGTIGCFSFFPSKNLGAFGDAGLRHDRRRGAGARSPAAAQSRRGAEVLSQAHRRQLPARRAAGGGAARQAAASRAAGPRCAARTPSATIALFATAGLTDRVTPAGARRRIARTSSTSTSIRVPERDAVRARLDDAGIGTEIYYPVPFHLQECFAPLGLPSRAISRRPRPPPSTARAADLRRADRAAARGRRRARRRAVDD